MYSMKHFSFRGSRADQPQTDHGQMETGAQDFIPGLTGQLMQCSRSTICLRPGSDKIIISVDKGSYQADFNVQSNSIQLHVNSRTVKHMHKHAKEAISSEKWLIKTWQLFGLFYQSPERDGLNKRTPLHWSYVGHPVRTLDTSWKFVWRSGFSEMGLFGCCF